MNNNKLTITPIQGADEVGGTCIMLSFQETDILFDCGLPLQDTDAKPLNFRQHKPEHLFLTHPHQDHYGRINELDPELTVHCGKLAEKLMHLIANFTNKDHPNHKVTLYSDMKPVKVGPVTVTPIMADHSAWDSYSFLVKVAEQTILLTGDLRNHGLKRKLAFRLEKVLMNQKIDILMTEGTNLGRPDAVPFTERELIGKMAKSIQNTEGAVFFVGSSTNFDRMIGLAAAAQRAGRILAVDLYTAAVMEMIAQETGGESLLDKRHVHVLCHGKVLATFGKKKSWKNIGLYYGKMKGKPMYDKILKKIFAHRETHLKVKDIIDNPSAFVIKTSDKFVEGLGAACSDRSETCLHKPHRIIYSMWPGYETYTDLKSLAEKSDCNGRKNFDFEYIHTSGHASTRDLLHLVKSINPTVVIPYHTSDAEEAGLLFGHKARILHDGVEWDCPEVI